MRKWLIVHSLESFSQNPRMIGFAARTKLDGSFALNKDGIPYPALGRVSELKPGHRVIYYCKSDSVIKGIYEVGRAHYGAETQWPDSPFQFEIKPIIELEDPYDFKLLLSSLDLFKDLADLRNWGVALQGVTNSIKPLTDHDYEVIEKAMTQAQSQGREEAKEEEEKPQDYGQHLHMQYEIADWGLKNNYRVHIAINDKNKIREKLPKVLEEMPKFLAANIVDIAKRVDILFFEKERDILTHAFEVEHTTTIYSGLLRLNDIAESYPPHNVKFFIISKAENRDKFNQELDRPSFRFLRNNNCQFREYQEVEEEWQELQKRKTPIF